MFLPGKCDDTIFKICSEVGWLNDLKKLIPKHTLDKHFQSQQKVPEKVQQPVSAAAKKTGTTVQQKAGTAPKKTV